MDFQNSLENQHIETRKKPHFGFFMLFSVSVSLNLYFLFFTGKNTVEIADAISQEKKSANLVESQVGGLEPEEIIPPGKKGNKNSRGSTCIFFQVRGYKPGRSSGPISRV